MSDGLQNKRYYWPIAAASFAVLLLGAAAAYSHFRNSDLRPAAIAKPEPTQTQNIAALASPTAAATQTPTVTPSAIPTVVPTVTPAAVHYSINIASYAFSPSSLSIRTGDSVTWTNSDAAVHTVTGNGLNSGNLAQGATYPYTFSLAGSFIYHCAIHPSMTGSVIVN